MHIGVAALLRDLGDHSDNKPYLTGAIPLVFIDYRRADVVALEATVKLWAARQHHSTRTASQLFKAASDLDRLSEKNREVGRALAILRRDTAIGGSVAGMDSTARRKLNLLEDPQMPAPKAGLNNDGVEKVKVGEHDAESRVEEIVAAPSLSPPQVRERGTGVGRREGERPGLGYREACPRDHPKPMADNPGFNPEGRMLSIIHS